MNRVNKRHQAERVELVFDPFFRFLLIVDRLIEAFVS